MSVRVRVKRGVIRLADGAYKGPRQTFVTTEEHAADLVERFPDKYEIIKTREKHGDHIHLNAEEREGVREGVDLGSGA